MESVKYGSKEIIPGQYSSSRDQFVRKHVGKRRDGTLVREINYGKLIYLVELGDRL